MHLPVSSAPPGSTCSRRWLWCLCIVQGIQRASSEPVGTLFDSWENQIETDTAEVAIT